MEQRVSPSNTLDTIRPRLWLGAVYHPEHWSEDRWPVDLRLMTEAGLNVVRMASGAWATLEPAAGQFSFGWLDRAIALLADSGISTILGTSSCAPPAWLVRQYPELLAEEPTGRRAQLDGNYYPCVNSQEFQATIGRLVNAMAEHFGPHPHVVGWQIDSKCNGACYCPRCQAGFRRYLADRYVTLDQLNRRLVTGCGGEVYSDWEQVHLPLGRCNPDLTLDFKHFITHRHRELQRLQVELLRPHLRPGVWIAGSPPDWNGDLDPYALAEDTDLASSDFIPASERHDYRSTGALRTLARGLKRRNFWILDTNLSNPGDAGARSALRQDEAQALAW